METKEYRTIDKSSWPRGQWDNEPDKAQWPDKETGLPCLAVRHPESGHWCGYVGVPEGHSQFQKEYDDVPVDVHGGLTLAAHCQKDRPECEGVCHVVPLGEADHVWWLGFDCAHLGDTLPKCKVGPGDKYRTLSYIRNECASLAKQLAAL